jgi:hypothetical protein
MLESLKQKSKWISNLKIEIVITNFIQKGIKVGIKHHKRGI